MGQIHGFDFFPLSFDRDGALIDQAEYTALESHVKSSGVTDVLFIAHGFRNNELEATNLYSKFLETFRANIARPEIAQHFVARKFAVSGVFWPSKSFNEGKEGDGSVKSADDDPFAGPREQLESLKEEFTSPEKLAAIDEAIALLPKLQGNTGAQDEFVDKVLSLLDGDAADPTEGLDKVLAMDGHEVLRKLSVPVRVVTTDESDDEGGIASVGDSVVVGDDGSAAGIGDVFKKIAGGVGTLLNTGTWYIMKDRAGLIGSNGLQKVVRSLDAAAPAVRLHLAGHSLGARVVTSCALGLSTVPRVEITTLTLLQGAFSHYGFSANNGFGSPGFFRAVIDKGVVKGPILATHSRRDTVVGYAYAVSSRLAGDNVKAIGDANDQYGGLGRNGTQRTTECKLHKLLNPGGDYAFAVGMINNINGDDIIQDHGDIKRAEVTWAFAKSLIAAG